jgi:hypothetical protein
MIRIVYTATRALNSHAVGDDVTLIFSAAEPLVQSRRLTRDTQKSLGNRRETLLHNAHRVWTVTTGPVQTTTLDAIEEFLQAVEDGSQFDFEPFYVEPGSPETNPDSAETRLRLTPVVRCVLGSEQYDLSSVASNGTGGQDDWYQVTFVVEEVA